MSGNTFARIVGTVIGYYIGGPFGGAIGGVIGGALVPEELPDKIGPRLSDLRPQTSEYGRPIPIVFGTVALQGNVIWAAPLFELAQTTEEGGKGSPTQSSTNFSYYSYFAVAICEGQRRIGRIWAGPEMRLVYDGDGFVEGGDFGFGAVRVYEGTEDQMPDPLLEFYLGVGNVPAYRGTCYVVFQNFPVVNDGNRIPFLTVEVGADAEDSTSFEEWVYPVSGGAEADPDWAASYGMAYNSTTSQIWSVVRFDYYSENYTFPDGEKYIFQTVNPETGAVIGYIDRPNYLIANTTFPAPLPYENITSSNLIHDPTDNRMWLASPIMNGTGGDNVFCCYIFEWNATTNAFIDAQRIPTASKSISFKYDTYNGDLWARVTPKSSGGDGVTWARIDKSSLGFAESYAVTFDGLGATGASSSWILPTAVVFANDVTYMLVNKPALGTWDRAEKLWVFDSLSGTGIELENLTGTGRAFYDMTYDSSRNALILFAVEEANTSSGDEWMYRFDLDTLTLTEVAQLPASTQTLYINTATDPDTVPAIKYDSYRDLVWYFPYVSGATQDEVIALDAGTGEIVRQIDLASTLDPGVQDYYNQNGYVNTIITSDAVYINPYVSNDDSAEQAYLYDDRAGIIRIAFGSEPTAEPINLGAIVSDLSLRTNLTADDIDVTQLTDMVDGYVIANQTDIRSAIDPLRTAYYFDPVESGGVVKFVKRGGAIARVIEDDDLAATRAGSDSPEPLQTVRQMEDELPQRLTVTYMSRATKYRQATREAKRLIGSSGQKAAIELPLVLTDAKAQEVAEVNLHTAWVQRLKYTFNLGRKHAELEPTDIVVVKDHTMLITNAKDSPNGVREFQAVADDSHYYVQPVVVTETEEIAETVFVPSATVLELM